MHVATVSEKTHSTSTCMMKLAISLICIVIFLFSSPDITWHPSSVRPLTFHILIYSSATTGPNGTKLGRKHLYKVLYKVSSFRPIPPTNMATKDNSCFWLTNVKLNKSSPLKLLGQIEPNLAGSIYVRSSIKLLHLVPFDQQTWPLLLQIEHMVKLHVFGNNSKLLIISEIWRGKNDQHSKI